MNAPVYLDYNATAPARPEVCALMAALAGKPLNASAVHAYGREGRKYIEAARRQVAALAGADPENVIFNSGATEGNNTVLKHFEGRVLVSAIEHPSVLQVRPDAELIPVLSNGLVDLAALEAMLSSGPEAALLCVLLANNETGAVQPAAQIAALAGRYGAWFHCDAVQAAGKIPLSIGRIGAHSMALSAHKLGGPQGIGALVLNQCGETPVLIRGGGQEKKARAGTENVAAIAGFGLAAELAGRGLESEIQRLSALRDGFETRLKMLYPSCLIHAHEAPRLPNTSLFSLSGLRAETLLMALDLSGFCVSNGSACTSGKVEASHVLKAMNVPPDLAAGALRVSIGWNTQISDLDGLLESLQRCAPVDKIQSPAQAGLTSRS